jgi:cysteine desulfurase
MTTRQPIYLDYAAATPLDPLVAAAMLPYQTQQFYNPSATYLAAKAVSADIAGARKSIAHWLGVRPAEIIFTAGGSEANNVAIKGIMQQFPEGNIIVSSIEHDSVLAPASTYDIRLAPVTNQGLVDVAALAKLIDDKTVLVSVMYANNEVGTIQPLKQIAKVIQTARATRSKYPLYFHTDACQAGTLLDIHADRLGVDMMTINAGKMYGPKQCGALYVRGGMVLSPIILGGGQEHGVRSGTENVGGIIGFARAIELAQTNRGEESKRLITLQQLCMRELTQAIPSCIINGSRAHRLPNNIHVTIPGQDNERLLMELDERGIQAAAGSACSASNEEPSHVLKAMGISEADAQSSLRFTMGKHTTEEDIRYLVQTLKELVQ